MKAERLIKTETPPEFHIEKVRYTGDSRLPMHKLVLQHLKVKDHDMTLDIGCGLGEFIESNKNPTIFKMGVDIDPECIEICKKRVQQPNVHFRVADACKLPVQTNFFDVVTIICLLEHVDNPTALIREAYRVCRQGGIGVFVTPNIARPFRLIKAIRKQDKWTRSGHKQGWDYHLLKICLQYNGWTVEKIVTRFVDCPFYGLLPKRVGNWLSHKVLPKLFPRIGSELYAFCRK